MRAKRFAVAPPRSCAAFASEAATCSSSTSSKRAFVKPTATPAALFPEIVRRAAAAITRHAATMPPRTLLYVFGDHGFTLDASGAAYQGGASPEEVLVPAFAFLLGMVQ
ncbi:MAG: hypothetical protein U0235_31275 [Polyangiaceae bacterium]